MKENLRTVKDTAEQLSIAPVTLRLWMLRRRVAYVKLGRSVRIPESEIRRLIEQGTIPARAK